MTIWKPPTSQSHSTSTAQIKHYKHPPFPPSHALKLHCHGPVVAAWVGGLSWPRCVGLRSAYAHLKPVGEAVRAVSRASRLRSRPVSRHRLGPPFPVEVPATPLPCCPPSLTAQDPDSPKQRVDPVRRERDLILVEPACLQHPALLVLPASLTSFSHISLISSSHDPKLHPIPSLEGIYSGRCRPMPVYVPLF
ncbi:hypothetical protein VTN96DRAFT_4504 [Rasamsonia emersonii]